MNGEAEAVCAVTAAAMNAITEQQRWESFLYQHVETPWFDHDDRPKTMTAMREVFETIPSEVSDEMPNLVLFAPAPGTWGQVYPQLNGNGIPTALVFLSPELENADEDQVTFTVAHELAHVFLDHYQMNHKDLLATIAEETLTYVNWPSEVKADALVASWGFTIPKYRRA